MMFEIRPIREVEVDEFRRRLMEGFGDDLHDEDTAPARFRDLVDLDDTRCAFDEGEMVGTLAWFDLGLAVPDGGVRAAGTTMVTVRATHRRRGVLRAMMDEHLEVTRAARLPVAVLWASESAIYGRFGFGLATDAVSVSFDAAAAGIGPDATTPVALVDAEKAATLLPPVYERARRERPGMLERTERWWHWRFIDDPSWERQGRSRRRYVVVGDPANPDGYAMYRQKQQWEAFPTGTVHVTEVVAATREAHRALWAYLTSIDLFPQVSYWNQPADDELRWRATDPRRIRGTVSDGMWLRVLDVPAAMEARRYGADGSFRLGITTSSVPDISGTYELVIENGRATCRPTDTRPEVTMGASELGASYLGAPRLRGLWRAGRVAGPERVVAALGRSLEWPIAPWCPEIF